MAVGHDRVGNRGPPEPFANLACRLADRRHIRARSASVANPQRCPGLRRPEVQWEPQPRADGTRAAVMNKPDSRCSAAAPVAACKRDRLMADSRADIPEQWAGRAALRFVKGS